jgi:hypothetical protein
VQGAGTDGASPFEDVTLGWHGSIRAFAVPKLPVSPRSPATNTAAGEEDARVISSRLDGANAALDRRLLLLLAATCDEQRYREPQHEFAKGVGASGHRSHSLLFTLMKSR